MSNGLIEVAVVVGVVALVILGSAMVWTMNGIRRTVHQVGQFFMQRNRDVPHIFKTFTAPAEICALLLMKLRRAQCPPHWRDFN